MTQKKGKEILVRLRSSDSSWFRVGIYLFFYLLKRMIISITVLLVTRILLNFNWEISLALEVAFFAPFLNDLLDFFFSVMDRIPLSVGGDGSGPSLSKRPSFYIDLNRSAVEQALYELIQQEIESKKQKLANLLDPLIQKEAEKFPNINIKKLPSSRDMVEELIRRLSGDKVHQENEGNATSFKNIKTWLTRACQNAEDETLGRMSIRSEIRAIIQKYSQDDS